MHIGCGSDRKPYGAETPAFMAQWLPSSMDEAWSLTGSAAEYCNRTLLAASVPSFGPIIALTRIRSEGPTARGLVMAARSEQAHDAYLTTGQGWCRRRRSGGERVCDSIGARRGAQVRWYAPAVPPKSVLPAAAEIRVVGHGVQLAFVLTSCSELSMQAPANKGAFALRT